MYWTIKYAKKYAKIKILLYQVIQKIIGKIAIDEKVKFLKRPRKISKDKSSVYLTIIHTLKKLKKFPNINT